MLIFIFLFIFEIKADLIERVADYAHDWSTQDWQNSELQKLAESDRNDVELSGRFYKALSTELTSAKKQELLNTFANINRIKEKTRDNTMSLADKLELKKQKDYVQGILLIRKN